jgi:hypothetical protein
VAGLATQRGQFCTLYGPPGRPGGVEAGGWRKLRRTDKTFRCVLTPPSSAGGTIHGLNCISVGIFPLIVFADRRVRIADMCIQRLETTLIPRVQKISSHHCLHVIGKEPALPGSFTASYASAQTLHDLETPTSPQTTWQRVHNSQVHELCETPPSFPVH